MNWKNKFILNAVAFATAAILMSASPAMAGAYEEYQSITRILEEKPAEAKAAVAKFEKRWEKGSPQERTMAAYLRLRVSLYLTDYRSGLKAAKKLLDLKPEHEQLVSLLKLCAQLSYQTEAWNDVVPYVTRWEEAASEAQKKGEPYAEMASLGAYSLWQKGKVKASIPWMEKAFGLSPKEERGTFLLAAWQKLDNQKAQLNFLPTMVKLYGRPMYWAQWGYLTYEDGKSKKALDILSSADKAGRLPPKLYPLLVDLEMREGAASKAISILVNNPTLFEPMLYRNLLVAAYLKAGDRQKALDASLAILKSEPREAKGLSAKTRRMNEETSARLAFAEEKWPLAYQKTKALAAATKNDVKKADFWRFMAGVAAYEQKHWADAKAAFGAITDKTLSKGAKAWLEQIAFLEK